MIANLQVAILGGRRSTASIIVTETPSLTAHTAIPDSVFSHAERAFAAAGTTLQNLRRDFPEWHLGRPRYALWALDVDLPPVRSALADAGTALAGLLLDDYRRQAHITLALCGFPTAAPCHPDDYGPAQLEQQIAALHAQAGAPFEVEIGGLGSFTSAPFLAARDVDGSIGRLRQALCGTRPEPGGPYTPHVTVGLYDGAWPTAQVRARLGHVSPVALRCPITRVSLMSYAAPEIGGELEILGEFELASKRWTWRQDGLFLCPHPDGTLPIFASI